MSQYKGVSNQKRLKNIFVPKMEQNMMRPCNVFLYRFLVVSAVGQIISEIPTDKVIQWSSYSSTL